MNLKSQFNPPSVCVKPFVYLACLSLLIASMLTGRPAGAANPVQLIASPIYRAVSDPLLSSAAVNLVVNDPGDAADASIGDGTCDTSAAAGDQCTLRAAIQEANAVAGDDTVSFSTSLNGSAITLNTALPNISSNLDLFGPGADLLRVQRSTVGGTPNFRIFKIGAFLNVKISGITISNGLSSIVDADGGAIFNENSTVLRLTNLRLTGNATVAAGTSPAGRGGAIFNRGTVNLIGSTLSSNITGMGASGGSAKGGDGAGIYNNGGAVLNVVNSTISGNATGDGAATGSINITDGDGGGIYNAGTANIINSTISLNTTGGQNNNTPGGDGAGINLAIGGNLTVSNSTISGNLASPGGSNGGGINGGGTLRNTIIANNSASSGPDLWGSYNSQNHNLIENTSSATFTGTTTNNITGQDPLLGPLANNGGPTLTHSLLTGSPAVDAGSNANLPLDTFDLDGDGNVTETIPFDQRGAGFARIKDGPDADTTDTVDIGAFEAQPSSFISFSQANYSVGESEPFATITVNRTTDLSGTVTVDYATSDGSSPTTAVPCSTANSFVSSRCDFTTALGTLHFAAGESSKTFQVLISQDNYVEGLETLSLTLSNLTGGAIFASPSTATLTITDDASEPATNPIDTAEVFVRQHYHDFLNRDPDAAGLAFWANQITECQQPGATCSAEVRRINVSAAFFVSIEFQETGYLVYRFYKAGYGNISGTPVPLRLNEFLPDTQRIGQGVVVGVGNWQAQLEANKVAFAQDFVSRPRFTTAYPTTLTPAQFVDALFTNEGVTPSTTDRDAAINEFGAAGNTADTAARGRALRRVAENATFTQQEFNRAFVLMQYFGYLRRNPNDPPEPGLNFDGYNFWLGKLNQFNGNYIAAEMVKAFITSGEYRQRFGP